MTKAPNADKEVADWTEKIVQKGLLLLCADFDKLKTWQPPNRDATAFNAPQNADKNRSKVGGHVLLLSVFMAFKLRWFRTCPAWTCLECA